MAFEKHNHGCRILFLPSIIFLTFSACSDTQPTGTISGLVHIKGTTIPVADATVEVSGQTTTSSADGSYQLTDIEPGNYALTAGKDGFDPFAEEVRITRRPVTFDIPMTLDLYVSEPFFTDTRDSNRYLIGQIGDQTWMLENLAYLDTMGFPRDNAGKAYFIHGYNGKKWKDAIKHPNYSTYGVLYNWAAAMEVCPDGWHLPADDEWKSLEKYLGMSTAEADKIHWRFSGNVGTQLKSSLGWPIEAQAGHFHINHGRRKTAWNRCGCDHDFNKQIQSLRASVARDFPHVPDDRAARIEIGSGDQEKAAFRVFRSDLFKQCLIDSFARQVHQWCIVRHGVAQDTGDEIARRDDVFRGDRGIELLQRRVVIRPEEGERCNQRAGADAG
ncbi:MAG: FISUMP domain-containing protein, partial [Bacteroidales bacterium]